MSGRQQVLAGVAGAIAAATIGFAVAPSASAYQHVVNGCRIANHTSCPHADLSHADLTKAPLESANLFGANLRSADLSGANLAEATLKHADLSRAKLVEAKVRKANLHQVIANEADFSGAEMQYAELFGSQLHAAKLVNAQLANLSAQSVNFAAANLSGASSHWADFKHSNFVNGSFTGTTFGNALLNDTQFAGARFERTSFDGADVSGMNLHGSNVAHDHTARSYLFQPVYSHVNAYGSYGSCVNTSGKVFNPDAYSCDGRNDDPDATEAFSHGVTFSFGSPESSDRRRFTIVGSHGQLNGYANNGLGVFHVEDAFGSFLYGATRTGQWAPGGEAGGPLNLIVNHAGSGDYVMNVRGWVQRGGIVHKHAR